MGSPVKKIVIAAVLLSFVCSLIILPASAIAPPFKVKFRTLTNGAMLADENVAVTVALSGRAQSLCLDLLVNGTRCASKQVVLNGQAAMKFLWDTTPYENGKYTLTIVAKSSSGEQASDRVTVELIGMRLPAIQPEIDGVNDGEVVSGTLQVQVRTAGEYARNIVILEDGRVSVLTNIAPYRFEWDTSKLTAGKHSLTAQIFNADGDVIASKQVTVEVTHQSQVVATVPHSQIEEPLLSKASDAVAPTDPVFSAVRDIAAKPESTVLSAAPVPESRPGVAAAPPTQYTMNLTMLPGPAVSSRPAPVSSTVSVQSRMPALRPRQIQQNWNTTLTAAPGKLSPVSTAPVSPQKPAERKIVEPAVNSFTLRDFVFMKPAGTVAEDQPSPEPQGAMVAMLPDQPRQSYKAELPPSPAKPIVLLSIPEKNIAKLTPAPTANEPHGVLTHVVNQGENIWHISRTYGVEPEDIATANSLKNPDQLQLGQLLTIPGRPVVIINGKPLHAAKPFVANGRVMLPVRTVIEATGGKVDWSTQAKTITVVIGKSQVVFSLNQKQMFVNGKATGTTGDIILRNGRAFIPLRVLDEMAILPTRYEPKEKHVIIARLAHK